MECLIDQEVEKKQAIDLAGCVEIIGALLELGHSLTVHPSISCISPTDKLPFRMRSRHCATDTEPLSFLGDLFGLVNPHFEDPCGLGELVLCFYLCVLMVHLGRRSKGVRL
jgi:hypothetical protein